MIVGSRKQNKNSL